jgi:hypothetical protein
MKKSVFAGLAALWWLLMMLAGSQAQGGPGHYIGKCPELRLWKNNALYLKAKGLYSRAAASQLSPQTKQEWQRIVNKVEQLDAEMTEFVRTCSELKARAEATNARIDSLNRKGAEWNNRWAGKSMNSAAMAEKKQLLAEAEQLKSEQRARNSEWSQMKAQRETLNAKYTQLEQEVPRFISSVQHLGTASTPKSASKSREREKSVSSRAPETTETTEVTDAVEPTIIPVKTPNLSQLKEAHRLNDLGSKYYLNQEWDLAAEAFKGALERWPDNEEIRNNYELAVGHLEREERRHGRRGRKARRQLESVESHSRTASGLTDEAAKAEAMQGFDTTGKNAVDLSGVGKRPNWPAWVKSDKKMVTLQKQQDSYRATYRQKDRELSQVRQEMQTADPVKKSELAVKAAQIKGDLANAEYNIAVKEKDIRRRAKRLIDTREE